MPSAMLRAFSFLLASAALAPAQVDDLLANTATFKPRITVSDRYSERVVTEVIDRDYFRTQEPNDEAIAISVVANLAGADVGAINATTSVGVTAGYFDHSATLGEAYNYQPGDRRATFPMFKDVEQANGETRPVRVGSVIYSWTTTTLTVTVTCVDVAGAYVGDVAASDYIGLAEVGTSESIADDPLDVSVVFGNASGSRRAFLRGVTRTVTRGYGSGDNYETFDLTNVTLQGAADVTGPAVKPVFPLKPNTLNKIDVTGTATDLTGMSIVSMSVNGIETPATQGAGDPGTGTWSWSVRGVPLKKGANTVAIAFADEDGNVTKVTKAYTIR